MKKKELLSKCKEIRDSYKDKEIISSEDEKWLIDNIFKYHPHWEWWEKQGIKCISVARADYGTRCFYIHFIEPIDKITANISWNKCISNIKIYDYE